MSMLRRTDRGQTLVEFALVVPLFILLLVGLFDIGRAVYTHSTLNNAAREAGRLAIVDQTEDDIKQRAVEVAVGTGLSEDDVSVEYRLPTSPDTAGSCDANVGDDDIYGCLAVVRTEAQFVAATPIISQLLGSFTLAGEVRFPVQYNCVDNGSIDCPLGQ